MARFLICKHCGGVHHSDVCYATPAARAVYQAELARRFVRFAVAVSVLSALINVINLVLVLLT